CAPCSARSSKTCEQRSSPTWPAASPSFLPLAGAAALLEMRRGAARSAEGSPQLLMQKFACPPVGERCRRGVVVRPIVPGEGVTLTRIAVDGRVRLFCERRLDLSLRCLRDEFVLLAEVHQQGGVQPANLAEVFFRVAAVIANGGVDLRAGGRDKGHQCTEAVSLQGNLP